MSPLHVFAVLLVYSLRSIASRMFFSSITSSVDTRLLLGHCIVLRRQTASAPLQTLPSFAGSCGLSWRCSSPLTYITMSLVSSSVKEAEEVGKDAPLLPTFSQQPRYRQVCVSSSLHSLLSMIVNLSSASVFRGTQAPAASLFSEIVRSPVVSW